MASIETLVRERILILDGAMGTMIQQYNLTEDDFRGKRFAQIPGQLKGNNDILCLTRPDVIRDIHRKYLAAGADIIETNTFNSTSVSMADYHVQEYVREINFAAVKLAREVADEFTALTPDKPRFVAGSIGPTNKTCSMSPDVNNPAFRALTYDELAAAYREQMEAMLEAGVDALLIETIFDTLNAKAAIYAAEQAMEAIGVRVPLMLSVTVSDIGGRTLSGQTLEAFLASVQHADIFSVGLNEDSLDWETNPLFGWCEKNTKKDGSKYNLYTDGLKIYTTIDSRMQKYAEDAVTEHLKELQGYFFKEKKGAKKAPYTFRLTQEQVDEILDRAMSCPTATAS